MPNLQAWEIVLILLVILLLFGAKRLPDTARGLGRSLRIFKAETKGLRDDDSATPRETGYSDTQGPRREPGPEPRPEPRPLPESHEVRMPGQQHEHPDTTGR